MKKVLVLALLLAACGPAPAPTPRQATATGADPVRQAALLACPAANVDACVSAWVSTAGTGLPAVLCVYLDGKWSINTPGQGGVGRRIGEPCPNNGTVRGVVVP